ncbi:Inosine-5'-monophosphate dehydrogenase [Methanimicrococcus hongohii]|uniref:Inosine-5'-monophosphate dehydrogenase n=1 Tax=Methanimicrococcus hongohii TaxID=3028295 RepID=A0AA96UZ45_9EURY|nr:CBS domain-containing protein [Methanimicrococcus sp. Hf6]WNY23294.1 Inosine-5'-monophosphate dehydrogenase [Methanimicrococcus sp. Hf6]
MASNIPNVEDIMVKNVASATLPGSRDEVLSILKDKKVSGVPVLKDNKVVGIVSRTNILKNPEEEQLALLMTRNPITIQVGASLKEAARLLYEKNIRRLPVVDENGRLEGLITTADVIGAIADFDIETPIGDFLSSHVYVLWDQTPLPVVSISMDLADVKACPVIDSNLNLVGIISDRDVVGSSIIEDRVEKSDMSAGDDDDSWTWESMRDTMSIYYSVSSVKLPNDKFAKDIMVSDLISATKISTVSSCARKMKRARIDQIPVVDSDGKLEGMLLDRDLLIPLIHMEE